MATKLTLICAFFVLSMAAHAQNQTFFSPPTSQTNGSPNTANPSIMTPAQFQNTVSTLHQQSMDKIDQQLKQQHAAQKYPNAPASNTGFGNTATEGGGSSSATETTTTTTPPENIPPPTTGLPTPPPPANVSAPPAPPAPPLPPAPPITETTPPTTTPPTTPPPAANSTTTTTTTAPAPNYGIGPSPGESSQPYTGYVPPSPGQNSQQPSSPNNSGDNSGWNIKY